MWLMSLVALWIALLLVLFVPADLSLELERRPTFHVRVGFRWLLFRVRRDLAPTRSRFKNQPRRLRPGPIPLRTLIAVGKVPGLWASARRFARRLVVPVKQTVTYRASFGHVELFQEYRKPLRSK